MSGRIRASRCYPNQGPLTAGGESGWAPAADVILREGRGQADVLPYHHSPAREDDHLRATGLPAFQPMGNRPAFSPHVMHCGLAWNTLTSTHTGKLDGTAASLPKGFHWGIWARMVVRTRQRLLDHLDRG